MWLTYNQSSTPLSALSDMKLIIDGLTENALFSKTNYFLDN